MGLYALTRQPWKILESAYPGAGLVHATWRYEQHPHLVSSHEVPHPVSKPAIRSVSSDDGKVRHGDNEPAP